MFTNAESDGSVYTCAYMTNGNWKMDTFWGDGTNRYIDVDRDRLECPTGDWVKKRK